jgi:phage-related protein
MTQGIFGVIQGTISMIQGIFGVIQGTISMIQGIFGVIQGIFGVIQGIFGVIQGTYGVIQGTSEESTTCVSWTNCIHWRACSLPWGSRGSSGASNTTEGADASPSASSLFCSSRM